MLKALLFLFLFSKNLDCLIKVKSASQQKNNFKRGRFRKDQISSFSKTAQIECLREVVICL